MTTRFQHRWPFYSTVQLVPKEESRSDGSVPEGQVKMTYPISSTIQDIEVIPYRMYNSED